VIDMVNILSCHFIVELSPDIILQFYNYIIL